MLFRSRKASALRGWSSDCSLKHESVFLEHVLEGRPTRVGCTTGTHEGLNPPLEGPLERPPPKGDGKTTEPRVARGEGAARRLTPVSQPAPRGPCAPTTRPATKASLVAMALPGQHDHDVDRNPATRAALTTLSPGHSDYGVAPSEGAGAGPGANPLLRPRGDPRCETPDDLGRCDGCGGDTAHGAEGSPT